VSSPRKRLRDARRRRSQIASVFDRLKNRQLTVEQMLRKPPRCLGKVRIHVLLSHTPYMGDVRVKKCLERADIWPLERIGNLTPEQREEIINCLPPKAIR
jgi:hypothetical protein